jgi:hypothetical protein
MSSDEEASLPSSLEEELEQDVQAVLRDLRPRKTNFINDEVSCPKNTNIFLIDFIYFL